jgi:hypothetical protein
MPSLNGVDFFEVKKAYDDDGFVVLRGFLSSDEVRELGERTDALMSNFQENPDSKFKGVRKNLDKASPWFEEYFHHGAQLGLVAGLMNDKPAPSSAAFFDKPAGSSVEISQHIDGLGEFDGATIWMALDVADRGNGCLYYVKGSHRRSWSGEELAALNEDSDGAVAAEVQPGDVIIHSARTVHWSRKSTCTTRRRRAVSWFYWTSSCLEGRTTWPGQQTKETLNAKVDKKTWSGQKVTKEALNAKLGKLGLNVTEETLNAKLRKLNAGGGKVAFPCLEDKKMWSGQKLTEEALNAKISKLNADAGKAAL